MEKLKIDTLIAFCKDETQNQMEWDDDVFLNHHIVVKAKIQENSIALLHAYETREQDDQQFFGETFESDGFYHTKTQKLYCLTYRLSCWFDGYEEEPFFERAELLFNNALKAALEAVLPSVPKDYECSNEQSLKNAAQTRFFEGITADTIVFDPRVTIRWNDKNMDEFLTDADTFIANMVETTMANAQEKEKLLKRLNAHYLVKKELAAIYNDKDNIIHRIKALHDSLDDKKSVTVNLVHEGKDLSIKMETRYLHDPDGQFSLWGAGAADREKLKDIFGYKCIPIEDIKSVTYGKKQFMKNSKERGKIMTLTEFVRSQVHCSYDEASEFISNFRHYDAVEYGKNILKNHEDDFVDGFDIDAVDDETCAQLAIDFEDLAMSDSSEKEDKVLKNTFGHAMI